MKDLTAGSGLRFEYRGERELRGIPEAWRVFAVRLGEPAAGGEAFVGVKPA